jgi:adenine-specific DNA methylase
MRLIENTSKRKLRGGFYTPDPIAEFILRWGINGASNYDILEPSCGDGVFLEQLLKKDFKYRSVTALELDAGEAQKARKIDLKNTSVISTDFHLYCNETTNRFDLIVGNPPYIRYQFFDNQQQVEANKIFIRAYLKYTKLTNAWVSFIVGSSLLLKESGKIGFVVPAELLQVSYAKQLREFLSNYFNKIDIVSFKKLVFPEIQQEVVLLLCEKNNSQIHAIEHLEINDADSLKTIDLYKLKNPTKNIDHKSNKWTFYFLEQKEIDFLEEVSNSLTFPRLGDFADVEVGITTGSNEFFTVSRATVEKYKLQKFAFPLVGRSVQVNSSLFTKKDWKENEQNGVRSYLLIFPPIEKLKNHKGALAYLTLGEELKVNKGYKTGIRDEWQAVPSIRISDCLFIRRNNVFPKLILNKAKAYTTDTMHRITIKHNTNIKAFCASYYNSLSFAFGEISGRSYGGGVLELMPSEVEKIILPYKDTHDELFPEIDKMFREKVDISNILKYTNKIILRNGFGLTTKEVDLAKSIWEKLSQRRLNRSK